ncbi:MAG TPA: serine hydrolase domain-containing protein, partial [Mobilitalea sp.]|nr:serine hydrolase domain-containing protein [Mobilitalea sp.]
FPVCSLTKPVMGTILSIMQEEGLIDLNEPVRDYIPEFTGDEDSLIRIWHLLTHSSGLIDEDLPKNFNSYIRDKFGIAPVENDTPIEAKNEMYLKVREKLGLPYMEPGEDMRFNTYRTVILMVPPTHKPQKVMSYCNTGLRLAMDIVKSVSGRSADEYLTEKIFAPCKMVDSHFFFPQEKLSRYVTRGPEFIGSNWLNSGILKSDNGAGGLKSTVHDMTNLGQMYLNHGVYDGKRVLSTASVREITSDHNQQVSASTYHGETFESTWGLGWNVKGTKTDDAGMLRSAGSFEHGGFATTKLLCDPEADIVAAYFTVCKEDKAINAAKFNNMVIGAIE